MTAERHSIPEPLSGRTTSAQTSKERQVQTVTSRDGTTIAYEATGSGPALILVGAALSDRADTRKLAALLTGRYTVYNYDRRGRGGSGDTAPYAVDREIEDLEAVIRAAGGSAAVFGSSSGAVLALRAAAAGLPITKLAIFEPPFRVDGAGKPLPSDLDERINGFLAAGRRSDAVSYFMRTAVGVPGPMLLFMRVWPGLWSKLTGMAHTLPYDQAIMGETLSGRPLSPTTWSTVSAPTLVLDGARSDATFRSAAAATAEVVPNARLQTLDGLNHGAVEMNPMAIAAAVADFLGS